MKGLSIVVCCYNSASRLPETLRHIALQKLPPLLKVEVILVNNASTDDTKIVAIEEWSQYETVIQFRIIEELTPGLIFARNTGLKNAQYETIIFCDDDNWLHEDYLSNAYALMDGNRSIGALGGKGIGVLESQKPEWFDDFQSGYAIGSQATSNGDISDRAYVWGAGLVSRKEILNKVFDERFPFLLLGRKENVLLAGDDSEICKRILLLGYQLHYNDTLIYSHYIPQNRLTWAYKKKMFEGFELSGHVLSKYDGIVLLSKKSKLALLKTMIVLILKWFYAMINSNRSSFSYEIKRTLCLIFNSSRFMDENETKQIIDFYLKQK